MKKDNVISGISVIGIFVMIGLVLVAGKATAQLLLSGTEPGGEVTSTTVKPSYVSGDPAYQNVVPPDDNPNTQKAGPNATFSYFLVSGATLRGRSSVTQYTYQGSGCSSITSGTGYDRILNTELHIPDLSVIKYLRVYYIDTNPASGVDGFLTRYTPGEAFADLTVATGPDAFNGGFGFTVSAQITETVSNNSYAYTLIGLPDENSSANQICGLRVAYYPPYTAPVFLPSIHR